MVRPLNLSLKFALVEDATNADIAFIAQGAPKPVSLSEPLLKQWLIQIADNHHARISRLYYYLCNDATIHQLNAQHLQHDYPTDILTFPYSYNPIEAEIFLGVEEIARNAREWNVSFELEFLRVVAHGLLHMLGYSDGTDDERKKMRSAEDAALQLWEEHSNRLKSP